MVQWTVGSVAGARWSSVIIMLAVTVPIMVIITLLTATLVSVAGIVDFVVPHAVRLLAGPLHRRLCLSARWPGALLMIWVDLLGRVLLPDTEIPLGFITAILGVPFFLLIPRRRQQFTSRRE